MSNFIRRFASILGSKVFSLILSIALTPVLVRLLGGSLYGDYAFMMSIFGISMIVVNAGLFDGIRKYIPEDRGKSYWPEHVFSFYLRIGLAFSLFAMLCYSVIAWSGLFRTWLTPEFESYFYLLGWMIIGQQCYSLTRGALMGLGLENRSEPLVVLNRSIFAALAISLSYFGYKVSGVLFGHIISTIISSIIGSIILAKKLNISIILKSVPSWFPKKNLVSFNSLSVGLLAITASLYHVDILVLRLFTNSQSTGYYKAALTIAEFLWFVPNAIKMIMLPSASELWTEGNKQKLSDLAGKVTKFNLLLLSLLSVGLATLAGDFIPLYLGTEFKSSIIPLIILLPGALGFGLVRPIIAVGQGSGNLRKLILGTSAAAFLNFILNLILIPRFGMVGAAVATSISYGSMFLIHIKVAREIGFDPLSSVRVLPILYVSTATLLSIYLVSKIISSPILSLLFVPPCGFTIFSILTVRFNIVDEGEILGISNDIPYKVEKLLSSAFNIIQK